MQQFRKMTMGEVAEIAGDPKETIRARMNRGLAAHKKTLGWARLDVPSTVHIAVHAEMLRRSSNHDIALKTSNFIADSIADFLRYPPYLLKRSGQFKGSYLIFRCTGDGFWTQHWCQTEEDALQMVGRYIADTEFVDASAFYFVNVSTLADWALDRIFDLQGIEGNQAEAPQ